MKFKDKTLQNKVETDGIVKVPFLSSKEVEKLTTFIKNETPMYELTNQLGFVVGVVISEKSIKNKMDKFIREIVNPICETYIDNFKPLVYTAVGKRAGGGSKLDIHQDWSVVDESKFNSLSLWIPLTDITIENGAVHALIGSHNTYRNIRGGNIPSIFSKNKDEIINKMHAFEMKAGEALFFNQRLAHYSPENKTEKTRISVISNLVSQEAEVLLYYKKNDTTLELYKMEDDFYNCYENFIEEKELRPKGIKINEILI